MSTYEEDIFFSFLNHIWPKKSTVFQQ